MDHLKKNKEIIVRNLTNVFMYTKVNGHKNIPVKIMRSPDFRIFCVKLWRVRRDQARINHLQCRIPWITVGPFTLVFSKFSFFPHPLIILTTIALLHLTLLICWNFLTRLLPRKTTCEKKFQNCLNGVRFFTVIFFEENVSFIFVFLRVVDFIRFFP